MTKRVEWVDPETGEVISPWEFEEDGAVQELPVSEPSDLEERAGIDSLEELQTRRRMILENNTRLFALHGSFGLFDDYRKKMVEAQKIAARQALGATDTKVTESRIDAEAYGGEAYGKFMDTALEEKIAYLKLSTEILEIEEAIRSREVELRAYIAESSLR